MELIARDRVRDDNFAHFGIRGRVRRFELDRLIDEVFDLDRA
jgi:hypothetical protein